EYDNLLLSTVNCIAQISNHIDIQIFFYKEGCFLTLMKNCFDYDFTFNETEIDNSIPLISSRQFKNDLALKSAAAISNIASFGKENVYQNAIKLYDHLLTPFITKFLYSGDYEQFLKLFTTTIQNPNTIWNNKTRDELNLLLNNTIQTLELNSRVDLEMLNQFNYTDHKNQLIVSGIFIDNYNSDPTFKLDSPNKIVAGLINYLTDYCTNYNYSNNIDHFNEKDLFKQNKSIVDDDDDFIDFGEGNEEEDLYKSASK
ncbi:MAG: DnaJ subfamily C member 13, partial [Paramarteilia canceri]